MEIINLFVNNSGIPITDGSANTTIKIRRVADGFLYDWADGTFKNVGWTILEDMLDEIDPVNFPGTYRKEVDQSTWADGMYQFVSEYNIAPRTSYLQEELIVTGKIVDKSNADDIKRMLGLLHQNIFIDTTIYDADNNLVSARVRIYSDSASVGTNFNVLATYTLTATCTAAGQFTTWRQVEI